MQIDMWSLGCILVELFTGIPIFPGESETEQIHRFSSVLGLPPRAQLMMATRSKVFFEDSYDKLKSFKTKNGTTFTPKQTNIDEILVEAEDEGFIDFVSKLLVWKPEDRMTPDEAINHPWLADVAKKSTVTNQAENKS